MHLLEFEYHGKKFYNVFQLKSQLTDSWFRKMGMKPEDVMDSRWLASSRSVFYGNIMAGNGDAAVNRSVAKIIVDDLNKEKTVGSKYTFEWTDYVRKGEVPDAPGETWHRITGEEDGNYEWEFSCPLEASNNEEAKVMAEEFANENHIDVWSLFSVADPDFYYTEEGE